MLLVVVDHLRDRVCGLQHACRGVSDKSGVFIRPSGDVADAVRAGIESAQASDHEGDRLSLDLHAPAVLPVLLDAVDMAELNVRRLVNQSLRGLLDADAFREDHAQRLGVGVSAGTGQRLAADRPSSGLQVIAQRSNQAVVLVACESLRGITREGVGSFDRVGLRDVENGQSREVPDDTPFIGRGVIVGSCVGLFLAISEDLD